jgi:hypothetical protein
LREDNEESKDLPDVLSPSPLDEDAVNHALGRERLSLPTIASYLPTIGFIPFRSLEVSQLWD